MSNREELFELLNSAQHAPMYTHSMNDWSCLECPVPLHTLSPDEIADEIIAAGWRPPARVVNSVEELEALPPFAVIRTRQGKTLEKLSHGWYQACIDDPYTVFPTWLPATVLFSPDEVNE